MQKSPFFPACGLVCPRGPSPSAFVPHWTGQEKLHPQPPPFFFFFPPPPYPLRTYSKNFPMVNVEVFHFSAPIEDPMVLNVPATFSPQSQDPLSARATPRTIVFRYPFDHVEEARLSTSPPPRPRSNSFFDSKSSPLTVSLCVTPIKFWATPLPHRLSDSAHSSNKNHLPASEPLQITSSQPGSAPRLSLSFLSQGSLQHCPPFHHDFLTSVPYPNESPARPSFPPYPQFGL